MATEPQAGTTNDDQPFEPGEIIEFAGDRYEVAENFGASGTVRSYPDGGDGDGKGQGPA
jgi:hypothetical protein